MKKIVLVLVLSALAAPAAAQPVGSGSGVGSGSPGVPEAIMMKPPDGPAVPPPADKAACVALARTEAEWFRGQCTAAVADAVTALPALEAARAEQLKAAGGAAPPPLDPTHAWVNALVDQTWPVVKRYKAEELTAQANASHDKAAQEIATDRRHVVLAYGAMWLLSVGFLIFLWRRQQGLRSQIDELKRDLEAAVKDGS
jgi:hypothetical protein